MDCTFTNPPLYDLGWLRFDTVRMRRRSCEVLYNETTKSSVMTDARCTLYSAYAFHWLWSVCIYVNIDKSLCHQSWQHMKPHSWFLLFQRTGNIFVSSRIHFINSLQSAVQTRQHSTRMHAYITCEHFHWQAHWKITRAPVKCRSSSIYSIHKRFL